jgi:hypothetical protein
MALAFSGRSGRMTGQIRTTVTDSTCEMAVPLDLAGTGSLSTAERYKNLPRLQITMGGQRPGILHARSARLLAACHGLNSDAGLEQLDDLMGEVGVGFVFRAG